MTNVYARIPSRFEPKADEIMKPIALLDEVNQKKSSFFKAFDYLAQMVGVFSLDGQPIYLNLSWKNIFGFSHNYFTMIHQDDLSNFLKKYNDAKDTSLSMQCDVRLEVDHQFQWFSLHIQCFYHSELNQPVLLITATNIQKRKMGQVDLMEQLGTYENMLDVSVDCIKVLDIDGNVKHMNLSGRKALGLAPDEKEFGMKWLDLLPVEVRGRGEKALRQAVKGKNARFAGKSVGAGITQYWDNILTPVLDEKGETRSILCVSRDVTLQKNAENKLRKNSEIDDLTGLYNRRLFKTRLKRLITHAKDKQQMAGILLIDLDHFKHVNDTLGHSAGDHLLRVLSKRLQSVLHEDVFIARLGGDEFAIAVGSLSSEQDFVKIAELASRQLDASISYSGRLINGGMSIGCALYPRDAQDASGLMQCVDTALNDLKADGRGGIRFFNKQMFLNTENMAKQLNLARKIIRQDLVVPYYQPKIDLKTNKLVGYEALLRWNCPESGDIQLPNVIQEAFKDYKLATKLSELMHTKIFTDLAYCINKGLHVVPVAINVAPVEFLRDDYAEQILIRMAQFKIPYHLVEIEVTEQILEERGSDYVRRALELLKQKGIRIALDDFGTGHSSLTRLKDYPVDCLKIDKSFINLISCDPTILAVVQAITQLGPKLHLDIVAEGIETKEQLDILIDCGCKIGQGFYFNAAINCDAVIQQLQQS
nr:EAL domain-containing protein [Acinetobacter sp. Marseille-Q1620]